MPQKSVTINFIRPWREAKVEFERAYVEAILERTKGHMTEAAILADKDRKDFYTMVRRQGIDHDSYRDS